MQKDICVQYGDKKIVGYEGGTVTLHVIESLGKVENLNHIQTRTSAKVSETMVESIGILCGVSGCDT